MRSVIFNTHVLIWQLSAPTDLYTVFKTSIHSFILPSCLVFIKCSLALLACTQIILSTLGINIYCSCIPISNHFMSQEKQCCIAIQEMFILHGDPSDGASHSVQRGMGASLLSHRYTQQTGCIVQHSRCHSYCFGIIGNFYR